VGFYFFFFVYAGT